MEEKDKRPVLKETKAPVVTPNPILEKATDSGGRLRVRGIYQKENAKNENNRKYPTDVWDRNFDEGSVLMRKLTRRSVLGELEHPESGTTHLGRVSHLIEKLWRERLEEGNEYGVPAGDYVLGQHLVLNTPSGKILQELYSCEIPVGVSSRGRGDVEADAEGVDVVQDNYEAETWDCVYQPSVEEANPAPVSESKKGASKRGLLEDARDLVRRASRISVQPTAADMPDLVELGCQLTSTLQRLTEDQVGKYNEDDKRAVCSLLNSCSSQLSDIIKRREGFAIESAAAKEKAKVEDKPAEKARRTIVDGKTKHVALLANMAERTVKAETAVRRLRSVRPRAGVREGQGVSKRRYDATVELADGLLTRSRTLKTKLTESTKKLNASVKLAEGLAERLRNSRVKDVVDAAVQERPELETSRKVLTECKSVDEARDKIKLLTSAIPAGRKPEDAPAEPAEKVESIQIPAGGDSREKRARGPQNLSDALFEHKHM